MANRTIYVSDEAIYARAQFLAARLGLSMSQVIGHLLAGFVEGGEQAQEKAFHATAERARDVAAELAAPAPCDLCGVETPDLNTAFDLTGTRTSAMTVSRLCEACRR